MSLERQAIKHYFTDTKVIAGKPTLAPGDHYHLLFKHNGDILFHTTSVVGWCHVTKPEVFYELTQASMRREFPNHHRVTHNGCNLSFRCIPEAEFWSIIRTVE